MKLCRKEEASVHENSDACHVYACDMDEDLDCAVSVTTGRYPDEGYVMNTECKELAYVQQGSGRLIMRDGDEVELQPGDCVVIEAGEAYYWDGEMTMVLMCYPKWTAAQHVHLE